MQVSYIKFEDDVIRYDRDIDCRLGVEFKIYSSWGDYDVWIDLALFYVNDDDDHHPDINHLKPY